MSDRLFAGFWLVLCAAMAWSAWSLELAFSYEPVGPRRWPMLLAALMAIAAIVMFVKPSPEPVWPRGRALLRVVAVAAALFVYAWTFERLGFVLATALMTLALGLAFGGRWWAALASGAGLGVGLYVFFDRLLDVVLPVGRLFT